MYENRGLNLVFDDHRFGFVFSEGKLNASDLDPDRISAKRRPFFDDFHIRHHAHIEEALANGAGGMDFTYDRAFSLFKHVDGLFHNHDSECRGLRLSTKKRLWCQEHRFWQNGVFPFC